MLDIIFMLNVLVVVFQLAFSLVYNKTIEAPFWYSVVYLFWFIPQVYEGMESNSVDNNILILLLSFTLLCNLFAFLGWSVGIRIKSKENNNFILNQNITGKWLFFSGVLGFLAYLVVLFMLPSAQVEYGGALTGPITILFFVSTILIIHFSLAVYNFLEFRTLKAALYLVPGAVYFINSIILHGRRAAIMNFIFIFMGTLYFKYSYRISRIGLLVVIMLGAMFIRGIGEYREIMSNDDRDISSFSLVQSYKNSVNADINTKEVIYGAYLIESVYQSGDYSYGALIWNRVINQFVPGQLVGANIKRLLLFEGETLNGLDVFYRTSGLTSTGYYDSFHSFSFMGCVLFFIIFFVCGRIYVNALSGCVYYQLFYMTSLTQLLHVITHSTTHYLIDIIRFFMFFGVFVYLSNKRFKT